GGRRCRLYAWRHAEPTAVAPVSVNSGRAATPIGGGQCARPSVPPRIPSRRGERQRAKVVVAQDDGGADVGAPLDPSRASGRAGRGVVPGESACATKCFARLSTNGWMGVELRPKSRALGRKERGELLVGAVRPHHREVELRRVDDLAGDALEVFEGDGVHLGDGFFDAADVAHEELLAADPAADVAGVFHAQHEAALGELAGLGELFGRGAVLAQAGELGEDDDEGGDGVLGVDAGVDVEGAGVEEVGGVAVDVVYEAALLAQLDEEPGGHAFAEDDGEELDGVAVRVVEGDAGDGHAEVRLFGGLVLDSAADTVAADRRDPGGGFGGGPVAEGGFDGGDDFLVDDVAGDGDEDVVGDVLLCEVAHHHVAVDAFDGLFGAGDVAAEGVVGPEDGVEQEVDELGGRVGDHGQLFEDDLALFLHLTGVHQGAPHELEEDVEGEVHVRARSLDVVDGVFAVGAAVEDAADAVDGLGDLLGARVFRRAFEEKMLDEMGDARLALAFVAGAGADVEGDGDGVGRGDGGGEEWGAVGGEGGGVKGLQGGVDRHETRVGFWRREGQFRCWVLGLRI